MSLSKKDFAKKYRTHPLITSRKKEYTRIHTWRKKTLTFTAMSISVILTYYLIYSPSLRLTKFSVPPTTFIEEAALRDALTRYLSNLNLLPFDMANFFLFQKSTLSEYLRTKYLVTDIEIKKKWPDTIHITFKEELSLLTFAYPNKQFWNVVNHKGIVVKHIPPFSIDQRLPLVWVLTDDNVSQEEPGILLALEKSSSSFNDLFIIEQYTITPGEITAHTNKNFTINVARVGDPGEIVTKLLTIITELRKNNTLPEEYIHLQFSGQRAFYK